MKGYQTPAPQEQAPLQMPQSPMFQQEGGNAFAQDQLRGAGVEMEGGDLAVLNDTVHGLWDARVDGTATAYMAVGNGPSNEALALCEKAVIGAILVATSEISTPLIAGIAASPLLGAKDSKIVEKFIDTFASAVVNPVIEGAVKGTIGEAKEDGEPTKDTFFHAMKAGLRAETVYACKQWRTLGAQFADQPEVLEAMTQAVAIAVKDAEERQEQEATIQWMNLLAQFDTGGTGKDGADLGNAGTGRDTGDKILGNLPRGVIHLRLRFGNPESEPVVTSAEVSGISEASLNILKQYDGPLSDMGLPVFILGLVSETSDTIEIGRNDKGTATLKTGEIGESWLKQYGIAHDVPGSGPAGAAEAITDQLTSKPIKAMGVELKWFK